MRNIYEIPARRRTAFRVEKLRVQAQEFSIWEGKGNLEFHNGEPVSPGRNVFSQEDVEGHVYYPVFTRSTENVVWTVGDEKPLPIRDAVIDGPMLHRWRQFVANIMKRESHANTDSSIAIPG